MEMGELSRARSLMQWQSFEVDRLRHRLSLPRLMICSARRSLTLARLGKLGATVVDEVVNYQDVYRLCYIRGPEGILIGLAQQLGQ